MGGKKSKNLVYTPGVPGSKELEHSAILRHPDAQNIQIVPRVWGCSNYYSLFQKISLKYPNSPFLGHRWAETKWLTYSQCASITSKIAANLFYLGLSSNDFLSTESHKPISLLGFFGYNSVEWFLTEIACLNSNIVTVGLLDKFNIMVKWAKKLNLKHLFCNTSEILKVAEAQRKKKLKLETLIITGSVDNEMIEVCKKLKLKLVHFEELGQGTGAQEDVSIGESDPCYLCMTSGTTQPTRFSIVSHLNVMSTLASCLYTTQTITLEDSYLSYLNFSLLAEKLIIFIMSASGGKVGLARDPIEFRQDLKYLKPTVIIAVPRMLEYLYNNIKHHTDDLTGLSKSLYNKAYGSKLKKYEKTGNLRHKIWDALVFKKARKMMGGNLQLIIVGSSMCNHDIVRYLKIVLGCKILEGYGLIEASAFSMVASPDDINCGSVGGPIMNLEIKLKYCGLLLEDYSHYYGELCLRGQSVSQKYYGNVESKLDSEGWLHTGDLVALVPETGAIKFIERLDYITKSLSGKCVFVQRLEILYRQSRIIAQILCVPSSRIEGVIAIVVPDLNYVGFKWKGEDVHSVCRGNEFVAVLMREFVVVEKMHKLKEHERVLRVIVEMKPWVEEDLITPTLKQKRYKLIAKYQNQINSTIEEIV